MEIICYTCRQMLPVERFHADRRARGTRKYARRCRDCQAAYLRDWRARNAEHLAAAKTAYYRSNVDRQRTWGDNWRARQFGAEGQLTLEERAALLDAFGRCCAYCGRPEGKGRARRIALDHAVPLERGGWHGIDNIFPACGSCNAKKRERTPLEWFLGYPLRWSEKRVRRHSAVPGSG